MENFIALTVSGAVSGAVYSLLAIGLVLTYQTSGVFNFAHAAVAFTTAFVFYELNTGLHWNTWVAAAVSVLVFAPGLGLLLDKIVFRKLAGADQSAKIVASVGLMIAIPAIALWFVGILVDNFGVTIPTGDNIFSPPGLGPVPAKHWSWGKYVRLDSNQMVILAAAAFAALALWFVVGRTRLGLKMRAAVDKPDLAESRGVDTRRTSAVSWALAFVLAGLAGVVGAPLFSLTPATYTTVLFIAATAAVLGALRSLPLAFAGGLALGLIQSLTAGYATFAADINGFSTSVPFLFLFLGLLFLNRDRSRVAGQVAESAVPIDHHSDLPAWRRVLPWCVTGVAFGCYVIFFASTYWQGLFTKGLAYSIIFLSFTIVVGAGGMVSLAQASFVTLASLMTGLLMAQGMPFILAALVGVLTTVAAGVLVALPSIRLGGLALALATLALALIGDRVLFAWKELGNGSSGWLIPRPEVGGLQFTSTLSLAILFACVFAVLAFAVRNLQRSASWRSIVAARTAPAAATANGISLTHTKLLVFAMSAGVAGIGGILLGTFDQSVTSSSYPPTVGLVWLSVVVLFGSRRVSGALLAGIGFAVSPDVIGWFTSSTRVADIVFGLGAVQLAMTPDGILSNFSAQNFARRQRRRSKRPVFHDTEATPAASNSVPSPGDQNARRATVTTANPTSETMPTTHVPPGSDRLHVVPTLRLDNVFAGYGAVEVLHGVSLAIGSGSITALVGPNGAGKSTLCKVAAGVLRATAGDIWLGDRSVGHRTGFRRSRLGVAYIPESRGVFPALTVDENLAMTLADVDKRSVVYDRLPGLAARRKLRAGDLSGGEQQMLTLGPLLIDPPTVVVADEPSLGLAPLIVAEIMGMFEELRAAGTAVLIVEEKVSHLLDIADEVALLNLGRISWSGRASDIDYDEVAASYMQVGTA
jgi:ABC-type branched-subunit amino acid transport system ATPase component/branched-subunit amino acid ABC-type transport system permease component